MIKKISSCFMALLVAAFMLTMSVGVSAAGEYKTWLQTDSRWGSKPLGSCGDTMAEIGCAVTSVAIQVVHSGCKKESEFNPGKLVDYLSKNGGFDGEGNLSWGAVTGMVSNFTFEKRAYFSAQTKATIVKELSAYINQGYYVVMSVNYDGHWIAIDTVKNGVVYMMDPAQNSTNVLFDYYNVSGMLQVRLFKGKNTPAKVDGTVPTANYHTGHYKTTDALNLRASATTSSDILLTIPKGKTVVVTRVSDIWGQVEYNDQTGWICLDYTTYTEGSYTYKLGNYKCNVKDGVNMRAGIGADKNFVCLVPYNATVKISEVKYNWGKATYGSKSGYICMEYLTYSAPVTTTTKPVTTTTKPVTTTTKPVTTTAKPVTTTSKPVTTTAKPVTTTTKPVTTTAKPVTTTSKPVTTTAKPVTTTVNTVTTASLIKGDINRDGKINNEDVHLLNMYINTPYDLDIIKRYIYDANGDNVINGFDVAYLMKKIRKGTI